MVKKEFLKAAFEAEIAKTRARNLDDFSIKIIGVNAMYCVALFLRSPYGVCFPIVQSYPMSYKSAYRLVCSL